MRPSTTYIDRGVVLHSTKYGENQLIVHLLTLKSGRRSYITRIGKSSGHNIFQPLFLVEFEASACHGELHRLSSAVASFQLRNIPFDIKKNTISLFLSELLYRLVREPLDDERMYLFVEQSIQQLDAMTLGVANFHLWFLVHLAHFMGYEIDREYHSTWWFDMRMGAFCPIEPAHLQKINPRYAAMLSLIVDAQTENLSTIELHQCDRVALLTALVDYYAYHSEMIRSVRSIEILSSIF
ncbi:MAG: DNA repair protein RecO [Mucinivorans sp.]